MFFAKDISAIPVKAISSDMQHRPFQRNGGVIVLSCPPLSLDLTRI